MNIAHPSQGLEAESLLGPVALQQLQVMHGLSSNLCVTRRHEMHKD